MKVRVVRESEVDVDCAACPRTSADGRPLRALHPQERVMERTCEACILKADVEQGLEPEGISLDALSGEPPGFIGDDVRYASRRTHVVRRGAQRPAAERYDLSELYGDDLLLRFRLAPTVFDLDDAALREKIELMVVRWPDIEDIELCELLFSDFDPRMRSEWDRERHLKVQALRRRGGDGPARQVEREPGDADYPPPDPVELLHRNQQEFSG